MDSTSGLTSVRALTRHFLNVPFMTKTILALKLGLKWQLWEDAKELLC